MSKAAEHPECGRSQENVALAEGTYRQFLPKILSCLQVFLINIELFSSILKWGIF
jgi:hypothetical protein